MSWQWDSVVAALGLAVPVFAGVWEFVLVNRKRLGYRVQMDTTATDAAHTPYASVLQQIQRDLDALHDPSFVLLRVENRGWTAISEGDYVARDDDHVGIEVRFPGRRVVGMFVTELSHDYLQRSFREARGLSAHDGRIELPKVKLNRRTHYKVLVLLERDADTPLQPGAAFPDPVVVAGIVGGVGSGTIKKTKSNTFASKPVMVFMALLVFVAAAQSFITFTRSEAHAAPLDCASGTLILSGSTAFEPVVREAAKQYEKTCEEAGARIPISDDSFKGSVPGLNSLESAGKKARNPGGRGLPDRLTFSDGAKPDGRPQLLPRPVALSLFTLVVGQDVGVQNLSLKQVRRIYAGEITNWKQVRGNDVPVHLVSRTPGSGTRTTLDEQVLDHKGLPKVTVDDCAAMDPTRPGRCEVGDTGTLLGTVATTPGALGHSEVGAATLHDGIQLVRIDGYPATLEGADEGAYPYWQTEIAYTYGEPPAGSIAAGFLRYLSNEVGKDILRAHGHRPCSELAKPLVCRPT